MRSDLLQAAQFAYLESKIREVPDTFDIKQVLRTIEELIIEAAKAGNKRVQYSNEERLSLQGYKAVADVICFYVRMNNLKVETFYRGPHTNIRVFEISGWA